MPARVRKAVIPAAGLGTRFLPATKALPKEMLPVVDKPGIQWVVEEAVRAGLDDILIIIGRGKSAIEDHFDRAPELEANLEQGGKAELLAQVREINELARVHFVRQGQPKGLGHAIGMARGHVGDEPFAVLLPDDLFGPGVLEAMVAGYERTGGTVVALRRFPPEQIVAYGVITPDPSRDDGELVGISAMVEKPPIDELASDLAIVGRYVFSPRIFDAIGRTPPGRGGELQITDAMALLLAEEPVRGYVFPGPRYDTGAKLDWLRATVELTLERPDLGPPFEAYLRSLAQERGWS